MKKKVVPPWTPKDRWDELDRYLVNFQEPGEADWHLWIARMFDKNVAQGRMRDFKTDPPVAGTVHNEHRARILDGARMEACGETHSSRRNIGAMYGRSVAQICARRIAWVGYAACAKRP